MEEKIQTSEKITLRGNIIGIYEKDEMKIAKIKYEEGFIEIIIKSSEDIYLGDEININGKLKIEEISQVI